MKTSIINSLWYRLALFFTTSVFCLADSGGIETISGPSDDFFQPVDSDLVPLTGQQDPTDPFSCWACNSTDETDGCFNLTEEFRLESKKQQCQIHEQFCKVERVWYIFGTNKSEYNFSIYRNCSATCEPYCVIMGDRTKVYSCATCCNDSFCNTGSSGRMNFPSVTSLVTFLLLQFFIIQILISAVSSSMNPRVYLEEAKKFTEL